MEGPTSAHSKRTAAPCAPARALLIAGTAGGTLLFAGTLLVAGTVLFAEGTALAHARLTAPRPRDQSTEHKDPNGPCGVTRMASQPVMTLTPGASLTVTWDETVNHPGCFLVDFSPADDADFTMLANVAHKTGTIPRAYSAMVTLPSTPCPACTLRVRQIMLNAEPAAGACPPATIARGATYYSCANVVLGATDSGVPGDAGGGSGGRGAAGTGGGSATGGRAGGGSGGVTGSGGGAVTASGGSGGTPTVGSGGATGTGGGATASGGGTGTGGITPATGGNTSSPGGGPGGGGIDAEPAACACDVSGPSTLAGVFAIAVMLLAVVLRLRPGRRKVG